MDCSPEPTTILIADNDVAVNALLTAILADEGLRCESVHDGEQALARLREGGVSVLVTDLDMPNLDGHELLAMLPEIDPMPATIVISGYLDEAAKRNLAAMPAVRHVLRKPFDVVEFADLVTAVVEHRGSGGVAAAAQSGSEG